MEEKKPQYRIRVNDVEMDLSEEELGEADIVRLSAIEYHLLSEHRSIKARIQAASPDSKKLTVEIGGQAYQVSIADELDQLLVKMGYGAAATRQVKEIKAPMPGLVLDVSVQPGQSVKQGDRLLILVAMKMENSILIPADAVIKSIAVKPGQAVEKGQLLIELA
jgi:biotin carboxyl carrier protein